LVTLFSRPGERERAEAFALKQAEGLGLVKRGRPPVPEGDRGAVTIAFRVTSAQAAWLGARAVDGESVHEVARRVLSAACKLADESVPG
jgi:hypothetical protein